jgi:hypothetical protein
MSNFFIDIGITVILRLLSDGRIPLKYVKGLKKVRDALNLAFPSDSDKPAASVRIVE